jgi:polysaccharide biosynthesis/export protein
MQSHLRKIIPGTRPLSQTERRVLLGNIVISTAIVVTSTVFNSCVYPVSGPIPEQAAAPNKTTLTSGDVIKFAFPGAPELNQSQKIRSDGKVNLPLIGEVDAAGKSIDTLQAEIALRYKPQLQNTTVLLTLESSVIQVVVSGAVSKPAKLQFEQQTTVVQAIMEAGGVSEFGSLRRVHLIRKINGVEYTQILDLSGIMRGEPLKPYYVRNGDVIFVPQSPF